MRAGRWSHHFVVGHELQDAGRDAAPELHASEDGAGRELVLVLVLQGGRGCRLLAIDGPKLGEHEGVEEGAHVENRGLEATPTWGGGSVSHRVSEITGAQQSPLSRAACSSQSQ